MAKAIIVGGSGTMADASNDNGGGYEGAATWAASQGANGGPLYTVTGAAYTTIDGKITKAGEFAVGLTGVWVHTKEGAAGAWGEEWYAITASDVNSITIASGLGDNADIDVWVGGALAADGTGIQAALDVAEAGDTIKVATDVSTATSYSVAAEILVDTTTGTITAPITVEAVNKVDGARIDPLAGDAMPILLATDALDHTADSIFQLFDNMEYYHWYYLDLDGGGAAAAQYCLIAGNSDAMYSRWVGCKFHNASSYCIYNTNTEVMWIGCEFYGGGAGGDSGGIYTGGADCTFLNCSFHDNTGHGFYANAGDLCLINCIAYNNSIIGFNLFSAAHNNRLVNCTAYGNTSDGFSKHADARMCMLVNCSASENLIGYDVNSIVDSYLAYNHAFASTADKRWDGGVDSTWTDAGDGNNVSGDPLFKDAANGDFTVYIASPLLGAGTPTEFGTTNRGITIGAGQPDIGPSIPRGRSRYFGYEGGYNP